MAVKTIGNVDVSYDSNALEAYLNTASMEAIVNAIDTTNLASTANEQTPGSAAWSVAVGGQWSPTLDGYLAPDAVTPPSTQKNLVVVIGEAGSTATYTWTANAFVGNYTIDASDMQGVITWSGTLSVSGAPVRS
jgi:hypothetical protein